MVGGGRRDKNGIVTDSRLDLSATPHWRRAPVFGHPVQLDVHALLNHSGRKLELLEAFLVDPGKELERRYVEHLGDAALLISMLHLAKD